MKPEWTESLREKLDQHYTWPALYTFKFVVPKGKEQEVTALFPQHTATIRASKNGNYFSVTIEMMLPSSQAVIAVYETAANIEGIIAL